MMKLCNSEGNGARMRMLCVCVRVLCAYAHFHSAAHAPKLHPKRIKLLDSSTLSVQVIFQCVYWKRRQISFQ